MQTKIQNVPTTIISGFLGVGKTTAILHLFSQKSATEKWAVLVNEFGKIGIDGLIYQANGISVKEIPGGCMCCAQGLPLQVAVNRLLRETKPDRLIIESSGVGHPAGIIKTLSDKDFNNVLTLKASICLLDPENLIRPEFKNNELFNEQIQFADILIANKTDLASANALQAFQQLSESLSPLKHLISSTSKGKLSIDWLDYNHIPPVQTAQYEIISNNQKTWQTHSFRYEDNFLFDIKQLKKTLEQHTITRLKGIIKTTNGYYLVNAFSGQTNMSKLPPASDKSPHSYIEVIDHTIDIARLEENINLCILTKTDI